MVYKYNKDLTMVQIPIKMREELKHFGIAGDSYATIIRNLIDYKKEHERSHGEE